MASVCLGVTCVKAEECLWSLLSSGFSSGLGVSLCAQPLKHRRRSSRKSAASHTDSLIFLRSCPFCGFLYPRCYRVRTLPLWDQHTSLQCLGEPGGSVRRWGSAGSRSGEAHARLRVEFPRDKKGIAALSMLEPPPLPSTAFTHPMTAAGHSADHCCSLGSLDTSRMASPLLAVPRSPRTLALIWLSLWTPFARLPHNHHVHEKCN